MRVSNVAAVRRRRLLKLLLAWWRHCRVATAGVHFRFTVHAAVFMRQRRRRWRRQFAILHVMSATTAAADATGAIGTVRERTVAAVKLVDDVMMMM